MNFADSFRAARWVRLINLLLQAFLFLALIGGLNYIALNHSWRFDITRDRKHSLSAETEAYLKDLDRDVAITVTITEDDSNEEVSQAYRDIRGLLREYDYFTRSSPKGKIAVRYVNIFQSHREAEELAVNQPNVVFLQSDGKRTVLTLGDFYRTKDKRRDAFQGEAALTAAILEVTRPNKNKIYFVTGHGEMSPDSVDGARGLSQLRDELRQRNFELAGLDLSISRKIPDDADHGLLIITSPQGRFQPVEEELLRNYLTTRAGRVILMIDPARSQGLENLLFDWGVRVYDNVIHDTSSSYLSESNELILKHFLPHPITQKLIDNDLPLLVGPARVVSNESGLSFKDGLDVKRLVATGDTAWGESSYRLNIPAEFTPGQDLRGQLGVMVISERLQPANQLQFSVRGGRLAVIGTADLVTNNRIINQGNLNLFLDTVNWAVERETQVNVLARPIQRFQLALSREELNRLRLGLMLGVPGIVALLGLIVYWTRRN